MDIAIFRAILFLRVFTIPGINSASFSYQIRFRYQKIAGEEWV